jgi:hypothetical protein
MTSSFGATLVMEVVQAGFSGAASHISLIRA